MKIYLISTSKYFAKRYEDKKILNFKLQMLFEDGIKHVYTRFKKNLENIEKYAEF